MRTFLLTAMAMLIHATVTYAQHQHTNNNPVPLGEIPQAHYFFMREEGKLLHVANGKEQPLTEAMTLENETLVRPDGTYRLKKGKEKKLRAGECMDMDGKVYSSINVMLKKTMPQQNTRYSRQPAPSGSSSGGHNH